MKLIIDDKIPFIHGIFEPFAEVEYVNGAAISPAHVRNATALIVRTRTQCNAALLEGSTVKFIASATIGYDHIDADYCKAHNIAWTNAAGCNSGAVEQYITAALLELASKHNIDLNGKTLGIVGVGNVGKRVLRVAQAMGMHVLQNDPPRERTEGASNFISLKELASQSDFITVHVPLSQSGTDKTFHLINADFFAKLKHGAFFINSSRGEVVDEIALKQTIQQGKLGGVALDVWEHEPDIDTEVLNMVEIGTPHIAGYSTEGKTMATQMAVQAVGAFFNLPVKSWESAPLGVPENGTVEVDCKNKNVQEILHFLAHYTYPIMADDAALRSTPLQGEVLRSSYHFRREFSAYHIILHNATEAQRVAIAKVFPAIG